MQTGFFSSNGKRLWFRFPLIGSKKAQHAVTYQSKHPVFSTNQKQTQDSRDLAYVRFPALRLVYHVNSSVVIGKIELGIGLYDLRS